MTLFPAHPITRLRRLMPRRKKRLHLAVLALLTGCFPTDQEADPPLDSLYYPVAAVLGADGDRIYVANSDFDLAYNRGTLMVLDAAALREQLPAVCRQDSDCGSGRCDTEGLDGRGPTFRCLDAKGRLCPGDSVATVAELSRQPGVCPPRPLTSRLLLGSARVAPFATDLKYVPFEDGDGRKRARLLMPARGDASLHWADVETAAGKGPVLDCGQNERQECDARHRLSESTSGGRTLVAPEEPVSVATSADGEVAVVAHQTTGEVSLYLNGSRGPRVESILSGLQPGLQAIVRVPRSRWATLLDPAEESFLAVFRDASRPVVELLRLHRDGAAGPYLQRVVRTVLSGASSGDVRSVAIVDTERASCEASCALDCSPDDATCTECLRGCASLPLTVFGSVRVPDGLLVAHTQASQSEGVQSNELRFSEHIPLGSGPSKVIRATIPGASGLPVERVFVIAFDAKELVVVDPEARQIETRISTGSGPSAFVVDEQRALGYLTDFKDFSISVLDLNQQNPTYGRYLLTVYSEDPRGSEGDL